MARAEPPTDTLISLRTWLVEAGLAGIDPRSLLEQFCNRLAGAGFPLSRGHLSASTLHPQLRAYAATWERGRLVDVTDFRHDAQVRDAWRLSPLAHMLDTGTFRLHRRLVGDGARLDFPVLEEMRRAGHTEWLGRVHGFGSEADLVEGGQLGVILTWATDQAGGWRPQELATIEGLSSLLALTAKGTFGLATARDLLVTYLGSDAAERVIRGSVRRGVPVRVEATILYADLRGFTHFADTSDADTVAQRLDASLDAMGGPVEEHGGQILKFLGDGLLAVFLADAAHDGAARCRRALGAADAILRRVAALNAAAAAAGAAVLPVDIALHEGEVLYGNVGTALRLDFTVIGPAVNEVVRLEGLCQTLGAHLVASESFRRAAGAAGAAMTSLGRHRLRGVERAQEVFAAPPLPMAAPLSDRS